MPVDPSSHADSLIASSQDISPVEQQNRFGIRHRAINGLVSGKFLTVLTIQTPAALSEERFYDILHSLRESDGVESMQTVFAATIPDFGAGYQNNLYLSAHLRAERADSTDAS